MHVFITSVLPALLVLATNFGQNRTYGKKIGQHARTLAMVTSALTQIFNAAAQPQVKENSALRKPETPSE